MRWMVRNERTPRLDAERLISLRIVAWQPGGRPIPRTGFRRLAGSEWAVVRSGLEMRSGVLHGGLWRLRLLVYVQD
jgi:hypothetical protein